MSIPGVAHDQVWYKQPPFLQFEFLYTQRVSQPVWKNVLEEISPKRSSVRGRRRSCYEHSSATLFIAPLDSFSTPKSGDKLSDQPIGPLKTKLPIANAPAAAISISKYSKDNLQQIFKTVLEARVPAPTPVLAPTSALAPASAPIIAETPCEKKKACSPDIYRRKSHIDCYNFHQQCKDYFTIAGATGPTQILFATPFFRDQISFHWQQYK